MNLIELSKYLQDEKAAEDYLYEKGILKRFTECPYCGSEKIGNISRGRIKCYKCKKEWHKRKGSFLEGKHISCSKFIGLIKLVVDDYGLTEISCDLVLDRKTVQETHNDLMSILLKQHKLISIDLEKPSVIFLSKNKEIRLINKDEFTQSQNSIKGFIEISFDRYKGTGGLYSFLINAKYYGNQKEQQALNNFLSFTKMRLISFRGIKYSNLFDYLTETIIRFNLREQDYYEYILKMIM